MMKLYLKTIQSDDKAFGEIISEKNGKYLFKLETTNDVYMAYKSEIGEIDVFVPVNVPVTVASNDFDNTDNSTLEYERVGITEMSAFKFNQDGNRLATWQIIRKELKNIAEQYSYDPLSFDSKRDLKAAFTTFLDYCVEERHIADYMLTEDDLNDWLRNSISFVIRILPTGSGHLSAIDAKITIMADADINF